MGSLLNLEFRALALPLDFFAIAAEAEDDESFLFGVVFGGANGCCGVTGCGVMTVTILRGLPRCAFLSLSLDFEPLNKKKVDLLKIAHKSKITRSVYLLRPEIVLLLENPSSSLESH